MTLASLVSQSARPLAWVIVNDGSNDGTGEIIDGATKEYTWIRAVHRPDRGFRKAGGGVIDAFYDGLALVSETPWDFLVKLDGDLSFGPNFFESCFERFDKNPRLGIAGGTICGMVNGTLIEESKGDPQFHVRGATKIYRKDCWQAIGGLHRAPGWDTIDEVKANMLGWKTMTFPELKLNHHRFTGNADGAWKNWVKNGLANYITGYHPLFMLAKCARRAFRSGAMTIPTGLGWGFFSGYLNRVPQAEPEVVRYVRREQMKRLLFRESLWG